MPRGRKAGSKNKIKTKKPDLVAKKKGGIETGLDPRAELMLLYKSLKPKDFEKKLQVLGLIQLFS